MTPLVLHLNGLPGVGKSTLARCWADAHPGTLLLDVDVLRTWISGWRDDFVATGAVARPVALAALAAHVAGGRDVVLPQLLADPAELARFRGAAEDAGARWVSVVLEAEGPDDAADRLAGRVVDQPHLEAVHALVADEGPPGLAAYAERLAAVPADARVITPRGDLAGSSARLAAVIDSLLGWPRSPGVGG